MALPLTLFTGSDQLDTVLADAGTLGVGLLVALLIGKMLAFGVSQASGFVGGPIFPALFIGGTAGVLVHQIIPGVPLGLAFTCLLAAVPGALIAAPFSMVLLAAFMTQVGALQTAPILIAVITAFLAMEGVKYLIAHPPAGARSRCETGRLDQRMSLAAAPVAVQRPAGGHSSRTTRRTRGRRRRPDPPARRFGARAEPCLSGNRRASPLTDA